MYNGEEICGGFAYYDADEVDDAIAELKDKCQMHDFFWEGCGFAKRGFKNTIAVSEAFDRLEAENAELKKKLMPCLNGDCILTCEVVEKYGKENAELKAKLEDAKATAYAESVDSGMENRKLKRALWLARAERAKEKQQLFHFSLGYEKLCIDGFYDPYSGRRELSPKQWIKVFNKVNVKCLNKAEEYK
jgi:hypothetical protein